MKSYKEVINEAYKKVDTFSKQKQNQELIEKIARLDSSKLKQIEYEIDNKYKMAVHMAADKLVDHLESLEVELDYDDIKLYIISIIDGVIL